MNKKKKIVKTVILIVICLFTECLISNFSALNIRLSGAEKVNIDLSSDNVSYEGKKAILKNDGISLKNGKVLISDVDCELKNICLVLSGDYYEFVNVGISYLDDNFSYNDGYEYNNSSVVMYSGIDEKNYYNVNSFGKVKNLEISLEDNVNNIIISEIILNAPPEFRFSLVRFILLLVIVFVISFGIWKLTLKDSDFILMKIFMIFVCLMICSTVIMIYDNGATPLLSQYPSADYNDADQYEQLFESFKRGHLNLDLDYDISKLEALDNPYDRSERNEKDTTGLFWDRAYYNGKFYSYFGVAPIFTVYYPVNIITGKVPTEVLASAMLCIYAVIFISLLYMKLIKHFCKNVPIVLAILGEVTILFGSAIFAVAFEMQFYYMAVLSGITWTAAFLFFLLTAYYESSFVKRIVFLVLSGISVDLIVASRPTLIFYGVVALVPAIFIFTSKSETLKRKISYIASIGVPVIIGAVLIMIYNYKRFDNPFEFGFNYQLTVSIAKANTFSLAMIPATIYHYFIQQPTIKSNFPYIEIKTKSLEFYHRYSYAGRTMGVLNYPVSWGFFLIPVISRKKNKFKTAFIITFAVSAVLMAYVDMCKAGSHYRYTVDILMPIILLSLIAIFDCLSVLKSISKKVYVIAYIFAATAMLATIYLGYLLVFANESTNLMSTYTVVARFLQNL